MSSRSREVLSSTVGLLFVLFVAMAGPILLFVPVVQALYGLAG